MRVYVASFDGCGVRIWVEFDLSLTLDFLMFNDSTQVWVKVIKYGINIVFDQNNYPMIES